LAGQAMFYAFAVGGFCLRHRARVWRCFSVPYAFCMLNIAAVLGVARFFVGGQAVTWQKASDLTALSVGGATQHESGE
jgi:hypothetical protein